MASASIYYHEDDYCQIEILPFENLHSSSVIMGRIDYDAGTTGFSQLFSRPEPPVQLSIRSINYNEIKSLLLPLSFTYYESVETDYANHREKKKNAFGFGFENYVLFVETESNNTVLKIWLVYTLISQTYGRAFKLEEALKKIGLVWHLILVDWSEEVIIPLEKPEGLINYLSP